MAERIESTSAEHSIDDKPAGRTFGSLNEIKETFFPDVPLEELEETLTEEQIHEKLNKIVEITKKKDTRRESRRGSKQVQG
jgi:hypothetical protein